jgi:hypothetical protein
MFHSAFQNPINVSAHQPKSDLIYQIAGKETTSLIYTSESLMSIFRIAKQNKLSYFSISPIVAGVVSRAFSPRANHETIPFNIISLFQYSN